MRHKAALSKSELVHATKSGSTAATGIKPNAKAVIGAFAKGAGVASLGVRPTVERDGKPLLEVFVFDFDETIYGRRVTVEFLHKLRDEEKYDDLAALTRQIRVDVAQAREYFATEEK